MVQCKSVTSWYCIKTDERIELIFGIDTTLHLSYTVLEGNSGMSKNKRTLYQTLDFKSLKFCNCTSTVTSTVNLGGQLM